MHGSRQKSSAVINFNFEGRTYTPIQTSNVKEPKCLHTVLSPVDLHISSECSLVNPRYLKPSYSGSIHFKHIGIPPYNKGMKTIIFRRKLHQNTGNVIYTG